MRKHFFTLLELLIIVAIIGILLSLLLPSLSKARETARKAICASNQAQIGRAINSYVLNNDQYMPASTGPGKKKDGSLRAGGNRAHYKLHMLPYLGVEVKGKKVKTTEVFDCPSTKLKDLQGIGKDVNGGIAYSREYGELYFGTHTASGNNHDGVIKMNYINEPSETVATADTIDWPNNEKQVRCLWKPSYEQSLVLVGNRHSKGINVLWVDLSVRWKSQNALRSGENNDRDYFYTLIKK